jgi:acetyl-CoA carboxylase biotin carboxyl carrier protein
VPQADRIPGESTPSPERVAELVKSLAVVMRQSNVTEIDLDLESVRLRLRRPDHRGMGSIAPGFSEQVESSVGAADSTHIVTSPMVGTFYSAPTPNSPPFASKGDSVVVGQTIGIIEAMKIMNEITADRSGVILEFLVGDGQPVEYGSPLLRLSGRSEPS